MLVSANLKHCLHSNNMLNKCERFIFFLTIKLGDCSQNYDQSSLEYWGLNYSLHIFTSHKCSDTFLAFKGFM